MFAALFLLACTILVEAPHTFDFSRNLDFRRAIRQRDYDAVGARPHFGHPNRHVRAMPVRDVFREASLLETNAAAGTTLTTKLVRSTLFQLQRIGAQFIVTRVDCKNVS